MTVNEIFYQIINHNISVFDLPRHFPDVPRETLLAAIKQVNEYYDEQEEERVTAERERASWLRS